ncbi:MAG TPA: FliM/FliN family flagellar motor switch protein [Stenotrophomonas sp.]|nr:FliM/FliN family flagellar motor switch protein [Stenotrophomonas sp.]
MTAWAGRRRYLVRVLRAPPPTWSPIRLRVSSSWGVGQVDLDLSALDPATSLEWAQAVPADRLGDLLMAQSEWLCVLEGLLGTALQIDRCTLQRRPARTALVLEMTQEQRGRTGRIGIAGAGVLKALQQRQDYAAWQSQQQQLLAARLPVRAAVCLRASPLSLRQLRRAGIGAVVRIGSEQIALRLRLRHGTADFPMTVQDHRCMIQSPPSLAPPPGPPLVAVEQILLDVDVVLVTLRLSVEEIARLGPGAILELSQSLSHNEVTLRCEGTPFATGQLVRIGQGLGVVIERISGRPAP